MMVFGALALYMLGWLMGFVTASLVGAVNAESKRLQTQKVRVNELKPPRN